MSVIKKLQELSFIWSTEDPFLFCAHHQDDYPEGNADQGPSRQALGGRNLGQDFEPSSSFRMYHGHQVPGFPEHPHRGFETITIALEGMVDHFDSMGASGRYGGGDIQWMTAGKGMQHCEMFPLVHEDKANPLHLFQIWMNLPAKDKFVEPEYKMIWHENLWKISEDISGEVELRVIAGKYKSGTVLAPVSNSWASKAENNVNIWLIEMAEGAKFVLPNSSSTVNRNLYVYEGSQMIFADEPVEVPRQVSLMNEEITIINQGKKASMLLLEGEPIGEVVEKYGPFVMNTKEEIKQAYEDYQQTQFGGWPWSRPDQVHERNQQRMAKYVDGSLVYPPSV